jgi:hypothetical protein
MELSSEIVFRGNNKGCDERLQRFQNNLHGKSKVMWFGINVLG